MTNGETKPRRRRPAAILLIVGALFIIVPFLGLVHDLVWPPAYRFTDGLVS
jgi:hypothetical protein